MSTVQQPGGVRGAVYDRGYRPYDGPRGGRRAATFGLYKATLRRALGIRRPWQQKVAPFVLLAVVTVPAMVDVGIGYVTRDRTQDRFSIITYRGYVGVSSALLLFVALIAPDIICPDRRQRVLSLMFARPLTGTDYVLAKFGAMVTILFSFSFLPQVVLFVGQTLVADGALDYVRDNADVVWKVPAAIVIMAVYYSVVGLAFSAITSRRIVAGATIIGFFLVTSVVSLIVVGDNVDGVTQSSAATLLNLYALPLQLRDLVFLGHIDPASTLHGVANGGAYAVLVYLAVVATGATVLIGRYRWAER